jgi:beta-lactam-binding protein with PASTA domain
MLVAIVAVFAMAMTVLTPTLAGASGSGAYEVMPNVVGLSPSAVHSVMYRAQLYYSTRGPGSSNASWVRIVGEIPAAGTTVPLLSTVTLIVTTTPAPVAPTGGLEPMPNVVGLSPSAVHSVMYRAQLYYSTQGPGAASSTWVRVVGELPAPGSSVPRLSTVTLLVSSSPASSSVLLSSAAVRTRPVVTRHHRVAPKVHRVATKTPGKHHGTTHPTHHVATKVPGRRHRSPRPVHHVVRHGPSAHPTRHLVREKLGIATWYSYVPGRCATWYLPFGVRVTVTDLANGHSVSCVVTDREGSAGDHAVDLSQTDFAELAPLSKGVIPVRVTW